MKGAEVTRGGVLKQVQDDRLGIQDDEIRKTGGLSKNRVGCLTNYTAVWISGRHQRFTGVCEFKALTDIIARFDSKLW